MSDLQKQNALLNDYVRTLQRQNQSKTTQIRTLTEQNDHLIQQCQSLRLKARQGLTSSTASTNNAVQLQSTIQKLQSQLRQSRSAYNQLLRQSQSGGETENLRVDIKRLLQEKLIVEQYNDKLEKQMRERSSEPSIVGKMKLIQIQLQESTQKTRTYENRILDYQRKLILLSNEVALKNSEIQRLNQKITNITQTKTNNQQLKSSQQYQAKQLNQTKINQYQTKITQLTNQLTITRMEVQRLKEKENHLLTVQRDNENYRKQINALNSKITSLSNNSLQINTYQTTINSLKNEQKLWINQKQQLQIEISNLKTQIVQKSNTIAQLALREEFLNTKQSSDSQKDKQIQSLNSVIRTLKVQIQDYKRTIAFRDSAIKGLQSRINSIQYSKSNEISSIQRIVEDKNAQMNRLIQMHNQKVTQLTLDIEKYKSITLVNGQATAEVNSLREENTFLKRQCQNNQIIIQQLQKQKENLKLRIRLSQEQISLSRSNINQSEVRTSKINNKSAETELTLIVRELKGELQQVKRSNVFIYEENHKMHQLFTEMTQSQIQVPYFGNQSSIIKYHSPQNMTSFHQQLINSPSQIRLNIQNESMRRSKHYQPQPYFKSQMNIERKRQQRNDRSGMSPVRDVKQTPSMNNRQKWQNLQRKISALRVQNDQLKKTLLYE